MPFPARRCGASFRILIIASIAIVLIASILTLNIGGIVGTISANPLLSFRSTSSQRLSSVAPPFHLSAPATTFIHLHAMIVSPENSSILYIATHKGLVVGMNSSTFKYRWYFLNDERMDVTGLVLDSARPFIIYSYGHPTANEETGIRRSYDRAQSWQLITTRPDPHQWVVSQSNSKIMYATDFPSGALIRSIDGGSNWKVLSTPANVLSITISPTNPDEILVGTDNGLYRSKDAGSTWGSISDALVRIRISAVSFAPSNPGIIIVGSFLGLMKSSNGGSSWTNIANGIASTNAIQFISIDPRNANVVYVAAQDEIYKTIDGGSTWALIRGPDQG